MGYFSITDAREHNLKNMDVEIPRDKPVVVAGLSGCAVFLLGRGRYG